MLYTFIKLILRGYFPLFFRKIHISGEENIPKNEGVIFVANHQNAFLDACLVAYSLKKNSYFLVRSEFFQGKVLHWIFKQLYLLPIHQMARGHHINSNDDTFENCKEALNEGNHILIFPEGRSKATHHLDKFKKGVGRIVLHVDPHFEQNVKLVPVSINYERHTRSGGRVWIHYAKPLEMNDYQTVASENKNLFLAQLVKDLRLKVKERLIVPNDRAGEAPEFFRQHKGSKNLESVQKAFSNWKTKDRIKQKFGFRWILKILLLPAYLPTVIFCKWLDDEDFDLSIKFFGILVLGSLQVLALFWALFYY